MFLYHYLNTLNRYRMLMWISLLLLKPLVESNPVPRDPISAIHPPCIYVRDFTSAMGFGLCISKMMNGIVALHSPPMPKDAVEEKGTLLRSAGCIPTTHIYGPHLIASPTSRLVIKNTEHIPLFFSPQIFLSLCQSIFIPSH
ncbi:hypothetical protein RIF29_24502 [Crotalaria pallida]|uniref:Uncharacterized protein n=1 Tax=Crotalaria pallida TaxID=3830 RepID=A0AAN9EKL1_CROPI